MIYTEVGFSLISGLKKIVKIVKIEVDFSLKSGFTTVASSTFS